MSLVRIYREMRDDPVPKIFTDRGDPGGMSGSLRRRRGGASVTGHGRGRGRVLRCRRGRGRIARTCGRDRSAARARPDPSSSLPPHAWPSSAPARRRTSFAPARRRTRSRRPPLCSDLPPHELAGGGSAQWLSSPAEEALSGSLPSSGQRRPMAVGGRARGGGRKRHGAGGQLASPAEESPGRPRLCLSGKKRGATRDQAMDQASGGRDKEREREEEIRKREGKR